MTQERKVQLGSEVDATGAKQGFEAIKQAGAQAADAISKSAGQAGQAVDGIGDGATKSAAKLAAAEKNIIGSIQRATAAAQAGERGTAAFYEALAKQRGVGAETLRPYLDQLRAAEAASRTAAAGVGQIGISAAQTAAALRGVPAQFTDIVTSIASGQQPLTVLLQQGGQLKDMFGGAGAAARALGGYVAGLLTPFTAAAAAAAALAYAYKLGSDEATAYAQALILSGNAAGVTAGQLQEMARGVAAMGAGTQGRAAEILVQLASAAGVGAANMQRFTAAAIAFEKAGGPAAEETAKAFQSLAKEPLAAALKLNEATNFLTASTYQQIKALEDAGRSTDAARLAQEAYASAIETRTPELVQSLGSIERGWMNIKSAISEAWDFAKRIGRADTLSVQLEDAQKRLAFARTTPDTRSVRDLQDEVARVKELIRLEDRGADGARQRAQAAKDLAEWEKKAGEFADSRAKRDAELLREAVKGRELVNAGLITEAQLRTRLLAITEKYAEKAAAAPKLPTFKAEDDGARAYMRALEGIQKIALDASASADGLTKSQAKLREIMADPAWAGYSRQQREQIITAAAGAQSEEDRAAAIKRAADEAKRAQSAWDDQIKAAERSAGAIERQVDQLQIEAEAQQLVVAGYGSLAQAIQQVEIARLREAQAIELSYGNDTAAAAIQREIEARQKLIGLIGEKEGREANEKAAKDAAREWEKATDQISQSLTDALMQGGRSGADYIKDLFSTMILRPVVQAIVNPVAGSVLGSLGFSGAAQAAGSAGGLGSSLSAIGGASSLAGSLGTFGSGFTSGLSAWSSGGSVTGLLSNGTGLFSGGLSNGLGTLAGSLGPIIMGAAAIHTLAKALDNGGTPHAGAAFQVGQDGKASTLTRAAAGDWRLNGVWSPGQTSSTAMTDAVQQLVTSVAGTIGAGLEAFGGQRATVRGAFASDNDDPSAGRLTVTGADGQQLVDFFGKDYAKKASAGFEAFAKDAGSVVRDALIAADLPDWADSVLRAVGDSPSMESIQAAVQEIAALRQASDALEISLGVTEEQFVGIARALGGSAGAVSALTAYMQAIYTESEQLDAARAQLESAFGRLGVAVPASAAAYRQLVEAQDLSTEAGRAMYAGLVQLAPAFGQVRDSLDAVASAAADAAAEAARRVADQRAGLEQELLQLQGNTIALREREIAALDPANRALQARIYALEDAEEAAAAAAELGDAWRGVSDSIEDEIERISGLNRAQTSNLAQVQAEFATATAQARAGDKAAAERLPELSRTLLELAQRSAASAVEVTSIRAAVADSLTQTAEIARAAGASAEAAAQARLNEAMRGGAVVDQLSQSLGTAVDSAFSVLLERLRSWATGSPSGAAEIEGFAAGGWHAGGLRIVGESGPEIESTGPARIWSAEQTARMLTGGLDGAALLAELRSLRAGVSDLHAAVEATAGHTAAISRLHRRWDDEGLTVRNDIDTPLATSAV